MRLKLTVCHETGSPEDVLVTADPGATVGQLASRLIDGDRAAAAGAWTLRVRTTGARGDPGWEALPGWVGLAEVGIASGAMVAVTRGAASDPAAPPLARLEVLGGPQTGRVIDLAPGSWILGRDPRCDVVLDDPTVSARHARLDLGATIDVVDLGAANGVRIDGEMVGRARIETEQTLLLGGTLVRLRRLGEAPGGTRPGGATRFLRAPRVEAQHVGERFSVPPFPTAPEREPLPWLLALAPLLIGVALAVALGRPAAMLIGLATPLMLLGGALAQRMRRRRRHRLELADFDASLAELDVRLRVAGAAELEARLAMAPPASVLLTAASSRGPLLWARRPEHASFLAIRLGTAALPSRTVIDAPGVEALPVEPRRRLDAFLARHRTLPGLPIEEHLAEAGALGCAGPSALVEPVLNGLLAQLCCLHSPAELAIAALVSPAWASRLDWVQWLPHASSPQSPLGDRPHLVDTSIGAAGLLDAVEELVQRRSPPMTAANHQASKVLPALILVIATDAPADLARRIALSEAAAAAGVFPIWVGDSLGELPAVCRSSIEVTAPGVGVVRRVRPHETVSAATLETVSPASAMRLARDLAPLLDAGAPPAESAALPDTVPLAGLLGPELLTEPRAVLGRWREHGSIRDPVGLGAPLPAGPRPAAGLAAIIGVETEGPIRLDLRAQGPHALVAGTTGAGKSEFLRSWVLALAAEHSPERLTFLFVDYKGGAAFADCVRLPHCVGLVTDLGPRLVRRALVSLRAELRHRERLFAGLAAKDLLELETRGDPDAPPALVLVIDEFAALATEVPEFVDGVLDLAQRGRALGIHLILATQRPAGVIKDGIKANTNLRIALRMADAPDSVDVLGVPDATLLDPGLPGRAIVRTGHGRLRVFQAAFTGGRGEQARGAPEIRVEALGFAGAPGRRVDELPMPRPDGSDDQERFVATIVRAAALARIPPPRRPWLAPLPARVELEGLLTGDDACIAFGLSDVPDSQRQVPAAFEPDHAGHLAVIGASGTGKSTVLRTLALATAVTPLGGPVEVYGLDFAGGALRMLESLPHVGSVIPGDDEERMHRLFRQLRAAFAERVRRSGDAGVTSFADYRAGPGGTGAPRVLLLIDGFTAFRDEWEGRPGRAAGYEVVRELLMGGRALGMHVALTADRAAALPSSVAVATQCRVQLRAATDLAPLLGITSEQDSEAMPPGRCLVEGLETQIAVMGESSSAGLAGDQARAIADYARRVAASSPPAAPIRALPRRIPVEQLPRHVDGRPVLGVGEEALEPLGFDPSGVLLVAGPPGSGRTTALRWFASSLRAAVGDLRLCRFATAGSPPSIDQGVDVVEHDSDRLASAAKVLSGELATGAAPRTAVIIESLSRWLGTAAEEPLLELVRQLHRSGGLCIAEEERSGWLGVAPLLQELRAPRRGLLLQPESGDAESILRTSLSRPVRSGLPAGRGVFVEHGRGIVLQLPHMLD